LTGTAAHKKLGPWMSLSMVMGIMIGSGVFLLPAALAPFGWNAVVGWALTIIGTMTIVLMLVRLTRHLPEADGPHGFVGTAFGPLPAFLVTWSQWVATVVANAAVSTAAVSYLSMFAPGIDAVPGLPALLSIGVVWGVTLVNLRGAHAAGGFQIVTTILKLTPLIAAIGITLWVTGATKGAALAPLPAEGFSASAITAAAALTLWAMLGFESASFASAQVDNPSQTLPRALIWGTALTGLIYIIACSGIALLMPADVAAASHAPFADFIAQYWGHGPALTVAIFAAISGIGCLNGLSLSNGALVVSVARAGAVPAWFGGVTSHGTPVRALLFNAALTTILLLLNSSRTMTDLFVYLALLSTSSTLFVYLGVTTSALRLRIGGIIGLVALGYVFWTLWGAGVQATGWSTVLLIAGAPVFWLMRRATRLRLRASGGQASL
jgi:APA family basic amino acid/polyamine antiporter